MTIIKVQLKKEADHKSVKQINIEWINQYIIPHQRFNYALEESGFIRGFLEGYNYLKQKVEKQIDNPSCDCEEYQLIRQKEIALECAWCQRKPRNDEEHDNWPYPFMCNECEPKATKDWIISLTEKPNKHCRITEILHNINIPGYITNKKYEELKK